MNLKVKICGITSIKDAHLAIDAGADALGFVFCEASPRCVAAETAAKIIGVLPPFVAKVGVFVNAPESQVRDLISMAGIDTLQFHGEEPPEFCRRFAPLKIYKAFRIRDASSLPSLKEYATDAWLLDSFVAGTRGGTGARFNWDLAGDAKKFGCPIILAGGLRPENVAEAIRLVRPYAVDVSSGVELTPGTKDPDKLRRFIRAAKEAAYVTGRKITGRNI